MDANGETWETVKYTPEFFEVKGEFDESNAAYIEGI